MLSNQSVSLPGTPLARFLLSNAISQFVPDEDSTSTVLDRTVQNSTLPPNSQKRAKPSKNSLRTTTSPTPPDHSLTPPAAMQPTTTLAEHRQVPPRSTRLTDDLEQHEHHPTPKSRRNDEITPRDTAFHATEQRSIALAAKCKNPPSSDSDPVSSNLSSSDDCYIADSNNLKNIPVFSLDTAATGCYASMDTPLTNPRRTRRIIGGIGGTRIIATRQ